MHLYKILTEGAVDPPFNSNPMSEVRLDAMRQRCELYLLPLLDGGHGIWLELQLVRPTQFPVEDGNDDDDHQEGDHHPDDDPHVGVVGVRGRGRHLLYSCRQRES